MNDRTPLSVPGKLSLNTIATGEADSPFVFDQELASFPPLRQSTGLKLPYVIAVCHQKGGVAKTTTTSALGAALAELNQKTLLIDLDPSGNLTCGLGFSPAQIVGSAADILLGNDTLDSVCRSTSVVGMDLAPSNAEMTTVSRFLNLRPKYEYLLNESLQRYGVNGMGGYDFVLIDCPPTLGPLTVTALTSARLALIPTQCEYYSLQALDGIFKTVASVRARTNAKLEYRLLITMFDRRGLLHTRVLAMLRDRFSPVLFDTMIGFDSKLRESQLVGLPITIHAPRTRATRQYMSLAVELYRYVRAQIIV
jgi:chromosome partitioning protein